jgi:FSR family fosmidomycin resistance protein-like MFS transporter
LIAASSLFYFFLGTEGLWGYIILALAGACLLASFSITIVVAQEIISNNAAMAAGLMLGFGIGIGGLGVGLVGLLAEHKGLTYAIHFLVWLPLFAGLLALGIKNQKAAAIPSVAKRSQL